MTAQCDEMVQLLTPDGNRVEHDDFAYEGDLHDMVALLRDMVLARRFDSEATALQRHGELGLWPPSLGQEAAQIGSGRAIRAQDVVFPTYREHGVAYCLDVPLKQLLALFRGADAGIWEGTERFRNYSLVIGTQTLHATGYAMGLMFDGALSNDDPADNSAVIAYHGDGASSQGDVNEAYVFASSYQAPVVFFCQNNQWAISEPIALQSRIPLYQRAQGFGFPGIQVDGNDVLAVHAVTRWAADRARSGQGPVFIEAYTYRMGAHTTSDDPSKYRRQEETDTWRGRDPIARLRTYLMNAQAIDEKFLADLDEEAETFGADVRSWVSEITDITMDQVFRAVHAEPTIELEAQRREYAEWVAGFEED